MTTSSQIRFSFFRPGCNRTVVVLGAGRVLSSWYDRVLRAKVFVPSLPPLSDGSVMLNQLLDQFRSNECEGTLQAALADWCDEHDQPVFASFLRSGRFTPDRFTSSSPRMEVYFPALVGPYPAEPGYPTPWEYRREIACLPVGSLPEAFVRGDRLRVRRPQRGAVAIFKVDKFPSPMEGPEIPESFDVLPYLRRLVCGESARAVEGGVA